MHVFAIHFSDTRLQRTEKVSTQYHLYSARERMYISEQERSEGGRELRALAGPHSGLEPTREKR